MIFLISGLEHMTRGNNFQSSTAQRVVEKWDQTCFRNAPLKDKRQCSQVATRVTFTRYRKKHPYGESCQAQQLSREALKSPVWKRL